MATMPTLISARPRPQPATLVEHPTDGEIYRQLRRLLTEVDALQELLLGVDNAPQRDFMYDRAYRIEGLVEELLLDTPSTGWPKR